MHDTGRDRTRAIALASGPALYLAYNWEFVLKILFFDNMKTVENSLILNLDKIIKWSDLWALDFNLPKTKNLKF